MSEQAKGSTNAPNQNTPEEAAAATARQNLPVECLDRFARSFETSARRWELVVYPSLFAFIVLAAYGFFLIYHLTSDIAILARNVSKLTASVDSMVHDMHSVNSNMGAITINMNDVSKNLHLVAARMDQVSEKMNTLEPMLLSIQSMDQSTRAMSISTDHMRYSVDGLNRGVNQSTVPIQRMTGFIPFW